MAPRIVRVLTLAVAISLAPISAMAEDPYHDLIYAVDSHDLSTVKELISRGMDVDTVDQAGSTLLMMASRIGSFDIASYLVAAGAKLNRRNRFGETALMLAALKGRLEICQLLIDNDAEYDHAGWNPLLYAATGGSDDVILLLLKIEVDIDATSENGTTALMMAAQSSFLSTVKLLVEHKADVNRISDAGMTAVMWAERKKNSEIVGLLRSAGATR